MLPVMLELTQMYWELFQLLEVPNAHNFWSVCPTSSAAANGLENSGTTEFKSA